MASRNGGRKVQKKRTGDLLILGSESKKIKDQSIDKEIASKVADLKMQYMQTEAAPSLGSASICQEQSEEKTKDGLSRHVEDPEARKEPSEYPLVSDSTSGKPKDDASSFDEPPPPEQKSDDETTNFDNDTDPDLTPPTSPECNCVSDSNCDLAYLRSLFRYERQLHKSKGYYVDSRLCMRQQWFGTPYPFKMAKLDRAHLIGRCILDGVAFAIMVHNKTQTRKLKLKKVIYSVESAWKHRTTFLGEDESSGETDYYQAHFFYAIFDKGRIKEKQFFELKREPDRHGATHYLRRRNKEVPGLTAQR